MVDGTLPVWSARLFMVQFPAGTEKPTGEDGQEHAAELRCVWMTSPT